MDTARIDRALDTVYRLQACIGHDACECGDCAYYSSWEDMEEFALFLEELKGELTGGKGKDGELGRTAQEACDAALVELGAYANRP